MRYKCPCCGYYTFPVLARDAAAYGCPVCYWENDVFISGPDEPSDENHGMTLNDARANFRAFGACTQEWLEYVRPPLDKEKSRVD